MTDYNYRDLCAELVEELAAETTLYPDYEREVVTRTTPPTRGWWRGSTPLRRARMATIDGILDLRARVEALEQRQAAPVPVPVAERLPGPEDCDAQGCCWWWGPVENPIQAESWKGSWRFSNEHERIHWMCPRTHWLPAHALPLPAQGGEVE